jgi:hypothetical protein
MKNRNITFTTILLALGFLALSPMAQAVVPAPDGGYPGGNTAEGTSALLSRTTGMYNTAVGIYSLLSLNDGNFCTGVGAGTLLSNTADGNTATGAGALLSNTTGASNTADGTFALFSNTATGNTAVGASALFSNTTGGTLANIQGLDVGPNVAVGTEALNSNTIASANTAVGYQALHDFTTGPVGFEQLGLCTAVGFQALASATVGFGNSGFGYQALMNDTDGAGNTAIGLQALFNNTSGNSNVAIGNNALLHNTIGETNTATGDSALITNTDGSNNTACGRLALGANTTGDFNTALGFQAGLAVTTASNVICIGNDVFGENVSDSCYIGNIFNATSPGGSAVFVNADGKLGTTVSSRRFKEEIKPMDAASQSLFSLKPVTFRYKKEIDATGTSQFGLVAEEVEKVNPDLVVRDKEGKPYSVRYDQVNAMLLNEFLKEHKRVEELERTAQHQQAVIAQQQESFESKLAAQDKQIEALTSGLQKVSAEIEMRTATSRIVKDR